MRYGLDALGAVKFEKELLQAAPVGGVVGVFLRTFGDARKTVERMAASGKFSEFVVHLAPFDPSHRYPINKLKTQLKNDAAWLEGVSRANPAVVFLLSPMCENLHRPDAMRPLFAELKAIAPSCLMLQSGPPCPGAITEIHLTSTKTLPKPPVGDYTVSFDGWGGNGEGNVPDADVPTILQKYASARHIRAWNFECNGKFGWKDKAPVNARKNWPSVEYLTGLYWQMRQREGKPGYPANALYKSWADDHDGPQGKDNKALIVMPERGQSVRVYDTNGNQIDTMQRMTPDYNTPELKGARYYSKFYAWQLGSKAQANTGSRKIVIESLPPTDADFRSSKWR